MRSFLRSNLTAKTASVPFQVRAHFLVFCRVEANGAFGASRNQYPSGPVCSGPRGGEDQYVEAVGELPEDNVLDGQSSNGMPLEAGDGHTSCALQGAAGVDAHFEQATGNGHVAASSGPLMGSIEGFVEASAMPTVQNPVPAVALPAQPLSVSGAYAHAPTSGATVGVPSRFPDPSELYALPRMPYPRMGYSPAPAGRMMPASITATVRTTVTTTVTSTIAASAAQAGLVYTSFTGPGAPTSGTYAISPMYGAADHQYHIGSTFVDPRGVGVYGYPDAGQAEVGAVGGVPVGAVGYPEPSGRPEQGSLVEELARYCVASRSLG